MRTLKILGLTICVLSVSSMVAQKDAPALPDVTAFECPVYPPLAQRARVQGAIKMQVTTDGHQATDIKLKSGSPMLAQSAANNIRTWKFVDHPPTTFDVIFLYVNQRNSKGDKVADCAAKMELPSKVTVRASF